MSKKKSRINKERIYDSMLDTINYNEKLVKDELDLTAKLAVSNVFTQPQQVPNGTLPQHATNKLQVETMFEMFKQQLRGYNFGKPDLTGKEYLGDGVYRLYDGKGITLTYNVYTGYWRFFGTRIEAGGDFWILENFNLDFETTISFNTINGTINYLNARDILNVESPVVHNTPLTLSSFKDIYLFIPLNEYIDYTFTLQIEKGDTATPYTVPGQIPQYKIVGEE